MVFKVLKAYFPPEEWRWEGPTVLQVNQTENAKQKAPNSFHLA